MAGSRLEKIGTIFSKVTGLLQSNALREVDKPLWYNVYKAFPPKYEPRYDRPVPTKEIPNIFYPEDVIRAKFYKIYGSPGIIDLTNESTKSLSQKFVEWYAELKQKEVDADEFTLFKATIDALSADGIVLPNITRFQPQVDQESTLNNEIIAKTQDADNSADVEKPANKTS